VDALGSGDLYPTNAMDHFKSTSYVCCGNLNAPYSCVEASNYSPTRYLHII